MSIALRPVAKDVGPVYGGRYPMSSPPPTIAPARPGWMATLAVLCIATVVISVLRDLFWADSRWVEVWLGFEVKGWPALLSAPLHWAIFAIAAGAFWRGERWVVPWAAGYLFYAALSHLIWSEASPHGRGWLIGLLQAAVISTAGWMLLRLGKSLPAVQEH